MKNSVKAILCLVLVVGVACTLAACSSVAGRYDLVSVNMDGVNQDASGLGYIDLNEDGTGLMSISGEEFDMCWADGQIWPADDPDDKVSFSVDGDTLTLDLDGNTATFKK